MTGIRRLLSRVPRSLALGLTPALLLITAAGAHQPHPTTANSIINHHAKCLAKANVGERGDGGTARPPRRSGVRVACVPAASLASDRLHGMTVPRTTAGSGVAPRSPPTASTA